MEVLNRAVRDVLPKPNEAIPARVIASGTAMIYSTRLRKAYSLRLCIISHQTTWDDVRGTIERIEEFGRVLSAAS